MQLDDDEHFGDDWVLTPETTMLRRCQEVIDAKPEPSVLQALVGAVRGSYHLKAVHGMLADVALLTARRWLDGDHEYAQREVMRRVPQAFRYGTRQEDLDLILQMCDEPTFEIPGDGGEDFRSYWFDCLAKIRDPRAADFCRDIVRRGLDHWTDSRTYEAVRIVGKRWQPTDVALIEPIARDDPDSELRRVAKRIMEKHL